MVRPPPLPRMQGARPPPTGERTLLPQIAPGLTFTMARMATPYWACATWSGDGRIGSSALRRWGSVDGGSAGPPTGPPAGPAGGAAGSLAPAGGAAPSWALARPEEARTTSRRAASGDRS